MRTDFRFRPAGGPHRAAAGCAARFRAASGGAAGRGGRRSRTAPCAICRRCCARRCARRQRHQGHSGESARPPASAAASTSRRSRRTLIRRLDGSRWRALVQAGRSGSRAGDVVRFGSEGRVCFLDQLDATVEAKGEGGEVTLAFAFHGAVLDQALAERGDMPLPPYIAGRRAGRRAGPRRLPDDVCARGGLGGRADRGAAFHRSAGAGVARARRRAASRDAACRRRHLPAGQGGRHVRPSHAAGMGQRQRRDRGGAQCGAARRRPHRRGRLHLAAAARKRGGRGRHAGGVFRRDGVVHHAGLSLPRRRRDADQFPSAALDLVHAGLRLLRPRGDAARLCPRDRERLSLLFLRRRLLAVSRS